MSPDTPVGVDVDTGSHVASRTPTMGRWITWGIVAAASVVFALSVGARFGILNHNSYLVHGLHRSDPRLLANDWLVSQSPSYHPVFDFITAMLFRLELGGMPFMVATLASGILLGFMVWWLVRAVVVERYRMLVYLLLMAMLSVTKTTSVMVSYIHVSEFQPSTLGGLAMMGAMVAFVRGRYIGSSLFLAATAVHLNCLVLGGPVFFLAHLALGRDQLPSRLLKQLLAPTLALPAVCPTDTGRGHGGGSCRSNAFV